MQGLTGPETALPPNNIQMVDPLLNELAHHRINIRIGPTNAQIAPPLMMYGLDLLHRQLLIILIQKPLKRIPNAIHRGHLIVLPQTHHQLFNEVVDAGGETAAGDDGGFDLLWPEEDGVAGAGSQPLLGEVEHLAREDAGVVEDEGAGLDEGLGGHVGFVLLAFVL